MVMGLCMPHCSATFVVILMIREIICPANGQCTTQGCDNRDQLMSIVDEILQLRNELIHRLDKQDQSINELNSSFEEMKTQLGTLLNMSSKAVDRCPLERDICMDKCQSMHDVFNESFQEMKNQHDTIVTSIQAVDRRLAEHEISTKNRTRISLEEDDTTTRSQTQTSHTFANGNCDPAADVCDCSNIKARGNTRSGVYEVCVRHQLNRTCTSAFCDMETDNRASLAFQRRKDGSVNFSRTWAEYKEGFGDPDGEFWLGNEMLYLLTSRRNYKLRVDLEDFNGTKRYAEYSTFSINSSADKYRLTISGYSGNAGNSLIASSGKPFCTIDVNNAQCDLTCALTHGGAWWYGCCGYATLNGIYYHRYETVMWHQGIHWSHWHNGMHYSLKATEMKLVPVA